MYSGLAKHWKLRWESPGLGITIVCTTIDKWGLVVLKHAASGISREPTLGAYLLHVCVGFSMCALRYGGGFAIHLGRSFLSTRKVANPSSVWYLLWNVYAMNEVMRFWTFLLKLKNWSMFWSVWNSSEQGGHDNLSPEHIKFAGAVFNLWTGHVKS